MTNRIALTLALLVALFVALQNCSEYWVMSRLVCAMSPDAAGPFTCEPEQVTCTDLAAEAASCCEESDRYCPAVPESDCTGSCSPIDTDIPCPEPGEKPKCCFLIHPLWLEPPTKLPAISLNFAVVQPELLQLVPETEFCCRRHMHPPPWGVHPTISSTVLRI